MRNQMAEHDKHTIEQALFDNACDVLDNNALANVIDDLGYKIEDDNGGHEIKISNKLTGWIHTVSC